MLYQPTTNEQFFSTWLKSVEWYDNTALNAFMKCREFYRLRREEHLEVSGLPDYMKFGSVMHHSTDVYYDPELYHTVSEKERRVRAFEAYEKKYWQLFADDETVKKNYEYEHGLVILNKFCKTHLPDDQNWEPIASEFGLIFKIYPMEKGEDFEDFYILGAADRIWRRKNTSDIYLGEMKTIGSGAEAELLKVKRSRQIRTYIWGLREIGLHGVVGVIPDIVTTVLTENLIKCLRDYYIVSPASLKQWRRDTIRIVQNIREMKRTGDYYRNPEMCTIRGTCGMYKLCWEGNRDYLIVNNNPWHPFREDVKEDEDA